LRGAVVPGSRWEYEPVYGQEPLRVTVQESEKVELLDSRGEPIMFNCDFIKSQLCVDG